MQTGQALGKETVVKENMFYHKAAAAANECLLSEWINHDDQIKLCRA